MHCCSRRLLSILLWCNTKVIRLSQQPLADESFVEILDTHTGLGPILDLSVMTSEHGRSQV